MEWRVKTLKTRSFTLVTGVVDVEISPDQGRERKAPLPLWVSRRNSSLCKTKFDHLEMIEEEKIFNMNIMKSFWLRLLICH